MQAYIVVVIAPAFDQDHSFLRAVKELAIEKWVAKFSSVMGFAANEVVAPDVVPVLRAQSNAGTVMEK